MIYKNVNELIGNTPLMELEKFSRGTGARIIAKLEMFNPAGSVKDRVGKYLIAQAEEEGKLSSGAVIIEPTSGNTGVGLAAVAASKGYRVILTMPETMSVERRNLLKAYGAEIVLTEGARGMKGAVEKAEELAKEIPGGFIPGQFDNDANPKAHRETTGPEIWEESGGNIDIFVSAIGTGGTITGVGEFLKSKDRDIKVIGVEPVNSAVLSGKAPGPHKIQGIGAGFVPRVLNRDICDEIITVSDEEAFSTAKALVKAEGIICGISSGAALFAACKLAEREENRGKDIVVILPDTGERYLSTGLFDE